MPFGIFSNPSRANIYEKHLPHNLYQYLADLQLLDGMPHLYLLNNTEILVKISKEGLTLESLKTEKEVIMITLQTPERKMQTSFSNKIWWSTVGSSVEEIIEEGNIKQFPKTGLSDWKCKLDTNNVVETTVQILDVITSNNSIKLQAGSCACTMM